MTEGRVEVITSVQRRRRWSRAEKERIVAAALVPGANASDLAREAGIHVSQLFRWRRQLCERSAAPDRHDQGWLPHPLRRADSARTDDLHACEGGATEVINLPSSKL